MRPFRLSRRTWLRGIGATVGLPMLECMLNNNGTALAAGDALPKRFIVWYFGNGPVPPYWVPTATGASWDLSPSLLPLAKVKSYLNVASGYDVKNASGGVAHHQGKCGILSATNHIRLSGRNTTKFGGPSIDQVIAQKLGAQSTFPFIGPGVCRDGLVSGEGPTLQYLSHKDSDSPIPTEWSPQALFDRLFGNFTPAMSGGAAPSVSAGDKVRQLVLDAVREDVRRLQGKLGSADRVRLDGHLTAIGDLQKQVTAVSPIAVGTGCQKPTRPADLRPGSKGANLVQLNQIMADLTRYALACDLTRVVAFHFSPETGYHYLPVSGADAAHHDLTHDEGKQAVVQTTTVWTMERLAYLAESMLNTVEGDSNLLRQSLMLVTSGVSQGLTHGSKDFPILLLGGAGGAMKSPGIHWRKVGGNSTDVLLTIHRALGTGITAMGKDGLVSSTPATEFLAS